MLAVARFRPLALRALGARLPLVLRAGRSLSTSPVRFEDGLQSRQRQLQHEAWHDPQKYWSEAAREIDWIKVPTKVLDESRAPFYRWFPDAELNTCYNAVDRHVAAGHGHRAALIYDSPVTGTQRTLTYNELQEAVAKAAGMLRTHGVQKGDRVLIYMPMVPEAVISMLACARIGAVHTVVFGGFASKELAKRIDDCTPNLVLTASCGIEPSRVVPYKPLVDGAISLARHKPGRRIYLQRPQHPAALDSAQGELDWATEFARAAPAGCVPVVATDPLYVLYTSGTTGRPKGIQRDNGGHAVALKRTMSLIYGVEPGDVFWAASDIGWVVGHSYIVYGPLLHGCTTILYEGKPVGTPDAGAFWRVCDQYGVRALFTAPTALRAIKREDPEGRLVQPYAMPKLAAMFLAGERSDPESLTWASRVLRRPVVDHWWMTETGWPITGLARGLETQEVRPGSAGQVVPGFDVVLMDESGKETLSPLHPDYDEARDSAQLQAAAAAEAEHLRDYEGPGAHPSHGVVAGSIALRLPLPPGTLQTLWRNDDGLRASYLERFPGFFDTGDAGYVSADGFLSVMTRADDIIQIAGHRLSTGMLEEVLASIPEVAECAVVGARDQLKGMRPIGFVVLKHGAARAPGDVVADAIARVRSSIGAFACFDRCYVVPRVPKTRSGKVLRRTLRAIVNSDPVEIPATIEDPAVVEEILTHFPAADAAPAS